MSTSSPKDLAGAWNPLLHEYRLAVSEGRDPSARDELIATYAFAIPDAAAIEVIGEASPSGVVEIGAGTGYWARLLADSGVDVVAYDVAPASSPENKWFAQSTAWFDVQPGDHTAVGAHGDRTLLLVWPTCNEVWVADAVEGFAAAGGETLVYVGEPPGGGTGDQRFHGLLGELDRCAACAYGITSTMCVCGVVPLFERTRVVEIPQWSGCHDDLRAYRRVEGRPALSGRPASSARWWKRRRAERVFEIEHTRPGATGNVPSSCPPDQRQPTWLSIRSIGTGRPTK